MNHTSAKTPKNLYWFKWFSFLATLCMLLLGAAGHAQGVARGYVTQDGDLRPGMVAALSSGSTPDKPLVERAAPETTSKIIGVTSAPQDSLVTIASGQQQVYVQTSGVVTAFVSDVNGVIKKNDQLSISPLKGILMKVDGTGTPIAVALEDFNQSGGETQTITTDNGTKTVRIVKMSVSLDVHNAPAGQSAAGESALQQLGRAIIGKGVGEIQVIVALVIFFVVLVAEGGIIYGAVSSAITSLGRNPMAKGIIKSELVRVVAVAITVLLFGLGAIYAVLQI